MTDQSDEQRVIDHLLQGRSSGTCKRLVVDAGDDAAVLPGGRVWTTDTLMEGVHFDERLTPGDVGWKAVAVNASDVGAMGGTPRWALLSVPRHGDG